MADPDYGKESFKLENIELDRDLKNLYKKWQVISKKLKGAQPNTKILGELNRSSAILRDLLSEKFNTIHVNNAELQAELKEYLAEKNQWQLGISTTWQIHYILRC